MEIGRMEPHILPKQNIAVWSQGRWQHFNADYIESIPASSQTVVNLGAIAASGTIAQTELTTFDVDEHQLLQLRWYPLDDVEGILWLTRSQGKFATRGVQSRVTHMSRAADPYLATTEFNILGRDRNAFVEVRNRSAYALGQARFLFWGYKYVLQPLKNIYEDYDESGVLRAYIRKQGPNGMTAVPLACTFVNAEGRLS